MLIHWFGKCSFLLQDSLGRRILTDPFDLSPTERLLNLNPQIITLSHEHIEVNSKALENNKCSIINKAGDYNLDFSSIEGYSSYQDKVLGVKRGFNIIYKIIFDNLNICHLGRLGHMLTDETINSLGTIDILFVPVGGQFTLNGLEAAKLVKKVNPKVVIPMYYKTSNSSLYLDSPKDFLTSMKYISNLKETLLDTNNIDFNIHSKTILMKKSSLNCIEKKTV
ncbi:MBL fold metallo-hydrolase [Clostridium paraputrificum]|uniref:MBL fold metallo-hydrolase n=1 Tax=Clostridium paraputrificum TaxID=29363 RepID=UPI003D33F175